MSNWRMSCVPSGINTMKSTIWLNWMPESTSSSSHSRRISRGCITLTRPLPLAGEGQSEGRSLVLEVGLALLHERRHAFLLVFGREERVEQPPLEEHPLGERRLEGAVDRFLCHHHRRQRELGDLRGGGERLLEQTFRRQDAGHEPRALRLGGVHHASGENEVHRLRLAHCAR